MNFHVITGLPRSGSTLLCNILNQNPKFFASSTSILPGLVANLINSWSTSNEIKGDLDRDKVGTETRLRQSLQAFCRTWYQKYCDQVVFDKSRGWNTNLLALKQIFPEAKVIVLVRDLRNVFASVEKQHQKFALLDEAGNPQAKSLFGRADAMFSPQGLIGGPVIGIEDMIHRKLDVLWIKFEQLTEHPDFMLNTIYEYLGQEPFKHNFKSVDNTATDVDALYLHKYPHQGSGEVKSTPRDEWTKYMSDDLAKVIMDRFPVYNNFFKYS